MTIEQEPFVRYHEEKKTDSFTIWLNQEERKLLEDCKRILEQTKDSTCMKQLAWIGAKKIGEPSTRELLSMVFKNKRKNKRTGIIDFE